MLANLTIGDWAIAEDVSEWIEVVAVVIIAVTVAIALVSGAMTWRTSGAAEGILTAKRQMARGLLLGLDVLIAADVIRTVTLQPTLENVAALGLLVAVRTFLSWALVVEIQGRWPWAGGDVDSASKSQI